jgi:hypothetical protein
MPLFKGIGCCIVCAAIQTPAALATQVQAAEAVYAAPLHHVYAIVQGTYSQMHSIAAWVLAQIAHVRQVRSSVSFPSS